MISFVLSLVCLSSRSILSRIRTSKSELTQAARLRSIFGSIPISITVMR